MMMIDKLAYSSPWRYKSVYLKSIFAVGTLFICVAVRSFLISCIILILMGCLTVRYSRASLSRYTRMMMWPFAFLIFGTIAILLDISREPAGICSLPVGNHFIIITVYSLTYALRLILVSLASVSCLYFLVLTTPVLDLMTLLKKARCPWILIELMTLIYRFIFVLLDSALSITNAQNCRLGNKDLKTSIKSMGNMLAALLVQALRKSSVLYDAMEARCYDGRIRVLYESGRAEKKDIVAVVLYLAALLVLAVICWQKGGL